MASLVVAALPVQIAAPILLRATRISPISSAYTAAVEENWGTPSPARCGFQTSLPWFIFPRSLAGIRRNALAEAAIDSIAQAIAAA
jgi:hypothetical protein